MAEFDRSTYSRSAATASVGQIDEGLRAYMLKVYNYMAIGLAITGIAALFIANLTVTGDVSQAATTGQVPIPVGNGQYLTDLGVALYASPLRWLIMFSPFAFILALSFGIHRMSVSTAQATFWAFSVVMGVSLSSIFLAYTSQSISQVFFLTAAAFGGLSLYGYTTKKDLTAMGSFMFMGLIGIILAMVVNLFLQSEAMQYVISVIGVLVFAGLTAYDTQKIKESYHIQDDGSVAGRKAVMGALNLYLDFINMFIFLLHLFGNRN